MGYTSQHIAFQLFSFHLCPCFLCNTHLIMKSYHNTCGNESCDKEKYQTYHIILIRHRKCMHRHCKKIIKQQHTAYRSHHSIQITGSCNCYDQYTHNIDHQNIFDEFVTRSDEKGDRQRGIGLGLAICKAVVNAHGGNICAENRKEGGARFMFWLEARQVSTDGR